MPFLKKCTLTPLVALMCLLFIHPSVMAQPPGEIFRNAGFIQAQKFVSALDFTLEDINGHPVDFKSFEGKTTLLYFWATWCGWCKKEVPSMISLSESFDPDDFVIVAVNIAEKREAVEKYVNRSNIKYPVLLDPKAQISKQYGVRGAPTHFIIDKKGIIRAYAPGYRDVNTPNIRKMIAYLIENET